LAFVVHVKAHRDERQDSACASVSFTNKEADESEGHCKVGFENGLGVDVTEPCNHDHCKYQSDQGSTDRKL